MTEEDNKHPNERQSSGSSATRPVIVGIGASAGCVQALQAFFGALPTDTGAAFVVVVHLDPQSHSGLSSILAARTRMPVVQVDATQRLEADHVYVIAPGRRLHISDDEISSAEFDEPRGHRAPIDLFFRSLAERHGNGLAVILTGAGSDGAVGVRAVKEAGGIILVQDPDEAEYPSMPRSAIATGSADFVLPVHELAQRVADLARDRGSDPIAGAQTVDEDLLLRILAHVRVRTGHDFSKYKRSTVLRRIARRIQVTRTGGLRQYCDYLREHAGESELLLGDLLISVTAFFRDSDAFDALRTRVIPQLFAGKDATSPIRVWVPGCATGEEAYSIAILLLEEAARHDIRPPIQIFATDLDARALAIAREGRYPAAIEADVSEELLRRYFWQEGDQYRVRSELRDVVVFAAHDLLKDPPFSRIDLISCRNLLVYLDHELQSFACSIFHYALNAGGFLLLGSAEAADNPPGLFRTIDRKARIYQSTARPGEKPHMLPELLTGVGGVEYGRHAGGPLLSPRAALNEAALHRQALETVAPPSILIDRTHRVLHLSEHAGRYLQPAGGLLSADITELVRPELKPELRSALYRVFEHRQSVLSLPVFVQFNGVPRRVYLHAKPVGGGETGPSNAVVMFIEGGAAEAAAAVSGDSVSGDSNENSEIRQLREELQLTQTRLRTTIEESEAATEELRAANEELQSINEEYRSTSEELETSKEELQSINEELQTVNAELKTKLQAVSRANSDLQNLIAATDFGTLFLDTSLRIKLFTEPVTEVFSITPSDVGRPITDFAHRLIYDDLIKDAQTVLARLTPLTREIRSRDGRWYDIRLRPYRTVDDRIDGVVFTIVDITRRRSIEEALRESNRQLRQQKCLIELTGDPISIWDFDAGIVVEWNRGCEELYGFSREEALGKPAAELLGSTGIGFSFDEVKEELAREGSWSGELIQRTKDGRQLTVEARLQLESFEGRRLVLVLECAHDITQRKALEERQRLLLSELSHRVKNTLAVVQAIAHQSLRSSTSLQEFAACFDGRLSALAAAHTLLADSDWRGADLATLAREQLAPYAADGERFTVQGPPVLLPAEYATPFGLVLHELATNAAKHGALAHPGGRVELSWRLALRNNQHVLAVSWQERDGPAAEAPAAAGFGTALIENAIRGATVRREFGPEGLLCTIEVALPEAHNGEPVQT